VQFLAHRLKASVINPGGRNAVLVLRKSFPALAEKPLPAAKARLKSLNYRDVDSSVLARRLPFLCVQRFQFRNQGERIMKSIKRERLIAVVVGILMSAPFVYARAADEGKEASRVENAGKVMQEILDVPDDIPQNLLDKARCVVVVPSVLKAAFVVGGAYGRGVMVCRTGRNYDGPWGAPSMFALEGGSFGLQIGAEATDFVFLIVNDRGADSLMKSKVKLGGDASVAAGPVGRTASADTDAAMRAEILTYSRARGVFAGISLEGSTLRPDGSANRNLYGRNVSAAQIVRESKVEAPASAHELIHRLQKASPTRS
jgi:lipid-binding SYLF domain-containing protein